MPENPTPDQIKGEIEAFLRRMSQQGGGDATPPPPPPPKKRQNRPRKPAAPLAESQPPGRQEKETVGQHVKQRLNTSEFEKRASHLTKVDQADEQMEVHLKQSFDHNIGTLSNRHLAGDEAPAGIAPSPTAIPLATDARDELLKSLADPDQRRNAIILGEILRRPEERW